MIISGSGSIALQGFGSFTCPNCGYSGLQGKHAPCPSCGGDVTVAHEQAGAQGMPPAYAMERGETGRSLADELKEQERKRLEPEHEERHDRELHPRAAAAAIEAAVDAHQNEGSDPHDHDDPARDAAKTAAMAAGASADSVNGLSSQELAVLREMQQRDREVRAHEQAHVSAGGEVVTGGASYTYQKGPDGKQYATGGEVGIDTSPVPNDPDATMEKAQTIRRAALAPAAPSSQDQKVAAQAAQMEAEARMEKMQQRQDEAEDPGASGENGLPGAAAAPAGQEHEALLSEEASAGGAQPLNESLAAAALQPPASMTQEQQNQPDQQGQRSMQAPGESAPTGAPPEHRFALPHGAPLEVYATVQQAGMQQDMQHLPHSPAMRRKVDAIA